ncbi:hypothetical protein Tco_1147237 [Tanacetum coccineum]
MLQQQTSLPCVPPQSSHGEVGNYCHTDTMKRPVQILGPELKPTRCLHLVCTDPCWSGSRRRVGLFRTLKGNFERSCFEVLAGKMMDGDKFDYKLDYPKDVVDSGSGILEDGGGGASRGGEGRLSVNRWESLLSYDWNEGRDSGDLTYALLGESTGSVSPPLPGGPGTGFLPSFIAFLIYAAFHTAYFCFS